MRTLLTSFLLMSILMTPLGTLAQISAGATSTATSTKNTRSGSNGVGTAIGVGLGVGAATLGVSLLSSVKGIVFGGKVIAMIPCSAGMLWVSILSARGAIPHPEFYIWTPFTVTKSFGPPYHPGQQVLGVADIPFTCFIGGGLFSSPIPLFGLRMQLVGTSL